MGQGDPLSCEKSFRRLADAKVVPTPTKIARHLVAERAI